MGFLGRELGGWEDSGGGGEDGVDGRYGGVGVLSTGVVVQGAELGGGERRGFGVGLGLGGRGERGGAVAGGCRLVVGLALVKVNLGAGSNAFIGLCNRGGDEGQVADEGKDMGGFHDGLL